MSLLNVVYNLKEELKIKVFTKIVLRKKKLKIYKLRFIC
jgi:hypothetical protein